MADASKQTPTPARETSEVRKVAGNRGVNPPAIPPSALGLKILHCPQDTDEITVDIVAVHGIGVNPATTWTHRSTKKNWLSDETMLPHKLPTARIMAFGYNSIWFGDNAVKQSLENVATKLLNDLLKNRDRRSHGRPILFIGHCFGGLVIQKAYAMALLQEKAWPHICGSVIGIVFLGTPHHGVRDSAGLSEQGDVYRAIVMAQQQIQDNALLSMVHDNDLLRNTVDDFTSIIANANPQPTLYCFFEEMATKVGLIAGQNTEPEFVVNQTCGTLTGHGKQGLSLDHFSMNKFENTEDYHYESVTTQILKIIQKFQTINNKQPERPSKRKQDPSVVDLGAPIATEANFAPRGGIIEKLKLLFAKKHFVALHGPTGSGKTHVAVQYTDEYAKTTSGAKVYWVNANNFEELKASYIRIGERLNIVLENEGSDQIILKVCQRLKRSRFLMVLDGLNSEDSLPGLDFNSENPLSNYVPNTDKASFLITTRSKEVAAGLVQKKAKCNIEVGPVDFDDASTILFGKVSKDSTKKWFVEKIHNHLNGSAGGLTMVASYLSKADKESNRSTCLEKFSTMPPDRSGAIRAWELVHGLIKQKHPETVDTLLVISCLNVQCVPSELFQGKEVPRYLSILQQFGLVEPTADEGLFIVTNMFREQAQKWLSYDPHMRQYIENQALDAVLQMVETDSGEVLIPCILAALELQHLSLRRKIGQAKLLLHAAEHDANHKNYGRVLQSLQQDRMKEEAVIDSPEKAALVLELGELIQKAKERLSRFNEPADMMAYDNRAIIQGPKLDPSEQANTPLSCYKATLQDFSLHRHDGALCQCTETANDIFREAKLQASKGNCEAAEKHYLCAMKLVTALINPERLDMTLFRMHLQILSSLASMHRSRGQIQEANTIFGVVRSDLRLLSNDDHQDTLSLRKKLARVPLEGDTNAVPYDLETPYQE